jgi:prepilin-type N-terminal cleavage/methylation domain-containing protein
MKTNANGFTIIELLVVTLLIAILTAIAVPQLFGTKERSYIASMRSDLRNLETAQEAYYVDHITYAGGIPVLGTTFLMSPGVSVAIDSSSQTGWGATATHNATAVVCTVAVTRARQGIPVCP